MKTYPKAFPLGSITSQFVRYDIMFNIYNMCPHYALEFNRPLTEMSTGNKNNNISGE
jgi:hypothetical protein